MPGFVWQRVYLGECIVEVVRCVIGLQLSSVYYSHYYRKFIEDHEKTIFIIKLYLY